MRGMGKVAQDKNQRTCKTTMGNGRAKEKTKVRKMLERDSVTVPARKAGQ